LTSVASELPNPTTNDEIKYQDVTYHYPDLKPKQDRSKLTLLELYQLRKSQEDIDAKLISDLIGLFTPPSGYVELAEKERKETNDKLDRWNEERRAHNRWLKAELERKTAEAYRTGSNSKYIICDGQVKELKY
jgi:hypothetical protein